MTTTYTDEQIDRAVEAFHDIYDGEYGQLESVPSNTRAAILAALSTLTHSILGSGDAADAARYRWLRDNCRPGENNNGEPHAVVKVCVGRKGEHIGWFSLIGPRPRVGVVTLDQAIDAALAKGNEHE